jgi:signal transduction histidine kinase
MRMTEVAPTDADFALVFDCSPHPYLLLRPDPRFTIAAVNRQYLTLSRRPAESLLGKAMLEAFPDNPAHGGASSVADLRASLERVVRERVQDVMGVQRYDIRPHGDEQFEERYWSAVNSPVFDRRGELVFIVHHVRDITEFVHLRDAAPIDAGARRDLSRMQAEVLSRAVEVKQANRQLKSALEEVERRKRAAEAANRELDAFSYSVAHDLRAPLRSIDGFSLALLEDYGESLDDGGRQFLGYVRESAQQMGRLIDDLLALSRVTRSNFSREPVDLSALAAAVAGHLERTQPQRRVEWVIAGGLSAQGDPRLLRIALENLLGNAWKFTGKCNAARIEVGVRRAADGQPEFFVADNGAGFDPAYSAKLFGVFQRLHNVEEFEGTGIGLATVQRIVHRHGGAIHAHGEVDKGASFHFTLGGDGQEPPGNHIA